MEHRTDQQATTDHVQLNNGTPTPDDVESPPASPASRAHAVCAAVPRMALLAAAFFSAPPIDSIIQNVVSPGGGGRHGW